MTDTTEPKETITLAEVRDLIAAFKTKIAAAKAKITAGEEAMAFWVNVESIVVCGDEPSMVYVR